jgi:hypothetical protein
MMSQLMLLNASSGTVDK